MKQLYMSLYLLGVLALVLVAAAMFTGRSEPDEDATLVLALPEEPPQLDSTRATDALSFRILGHCLEGLLAYGPSGELEGGAAGSWEINGRAATFRIRPDARWANGDPVTAQDFVFAWRTAVDPETASPYASILYDVENAKAINSGDLKPDELGAVAIDDRTLEVSLARSVPYFDQLTAFVTYFPVNRAFYERAGGRYGADHSTILCNGAFTVTDWVHGASLRLQKNPSYWNADAVRLDAIDYRYFVNDSSTVFDLFRSGDVDEAGLDARTVDQAAEAGFDIRSYPTGAVYYLELNHRPDRPTSNGKLRRALQAVLDPDELVNKVVRMPGVRPARSLFPAWLRGSAGYFRDEHPVAEIRPNRELGRRLLAEAIREMGLSEPPTLTLLAGDSPNARQQAEHYQYVLKETLGIDVRVDRQTFKQRLAKLSAGEFDLAMAGWGPDFDHPMTFADLFASFNKNNHGKYDNPAYDRALLLASESSDPDEQMKAFATIQDIVLDEVVVLLAYEGRGHYVQRSGLKGVRRTPVGFSPDYRYASLVPDSESAD